MDFNVNLKKLRKEKKWSQAELAKKSGISIGAIGNYESGSRQPTWDSVQRIAKAICVPLTALSERDWQGSVPAEKPPSDWIHEVKDESLVELLEFLETVPDLEKRKDLVTRFIGENWKESKK